MSKPFAAAFASAKDDPPLDDPDLLELWIERTLKKDIEDLSMGQLRVRASKLKIPFYTQYNKGDLILQIMKAQNDRKIQEATGGQPSENGRSCVEHTSNGRPQLPATAG